MAKGGAFILTGNDVSGIFTVSKLSEEQLLIRQTIKEFMSDNVLTDEAVKRIESKDFSFSRKLLVELGGLGFLGVEIPSEYGGLGLDKVTGAIVAEEVARQGSFATTFLAHTGIGILPIRYFGTEEQKNKYLPKLITGESVAAYCLTESGAGSDASGVKTVAIKDNDHYILNGTKIFVTNGGFADLFIVFAQVKDHGLTAFIVEKGQHAVNVGAEEHKMGIQGSSTAVVSFDNVIVPEGNVLGELGKGFKIALNILNLGRFKLAAASLGGGRLCFEEAVKYSKERKQFGKSISNFGAIKEKLAMMAAKNFAMEAVVYRTSGHLEDAIGQVDASDSRAILKAIEEFVVECSLVKVFCSEALDYVADENVQVHGGSGFCHGNPERHYRDSRINRIFEGTNEVNRLLMVGMLLKKAATGALPLMQIIKKVVAETMTPSIQIESEDFQERMTNYLESAKKAVLLVAGVAYEKFGLTLEEHQMVLLALSDCLINIYVMESSLAACSGTKNSDLVTLIFNDCLFEIEKLTRDLVAMCAEGDMQRTQLAMVRRLIKFTPANREELCNKIAERLI